MGGVAAIAKSAGHRVTGSDRNVYPPMSTQLAALGIEVVRGLRRVAARSAARRRRRRQRIEPRRAGRRGDARSRAALHVGARVARRRTCCDDRHVLAVAGTHGKTTTTSMLAWILEHAGLSPGFLIGGVAGEFRGDRAARRAPFFVIEADEYDTAFFDKRAKFVHYRPRTAVLNNLEYDHADIYPDVDAIKRQFNQLLRTVPGIGTRRRQRAGRESRRDPEDGLLDAARVVRHARIRRRLDRARRPGQRLRPVRGARARPRGRPRRVAACSASTTS